MLPHRRSAAASLVTVAALSVVLVGCELATGSGLIVGSGTPTTQQREVRSFTRLHVSTGIQARVTIGSPVSVSVTADDNLVSRVNTTVSGDTLEVAFASGSFTARTPVVVAITAPALDGLEADSAGVIAVDGLSAGDLRVQARSAGRIGASGTATSLSLSGDSGANIDLSGLGVKTAQVDLGSAASARVKATDRVSGVVREAATLVLIGKPAEVAVDTATAGVVSYQ